jgi:hypothetical protein
VANDQRLYDLQAMLASFGEPVTYTPYQGVGRSLTGIVNRDVAARSESGAEQSEILTITVLRDALDATYGGIDNPQPHDTLVIPGDPEGKTFRFSGNIFDKSLYGWRIEFTSSKRLQRGAHNVRK